MELPRRLGYMFTYRAARKSRRLSPSELVAHDALGLSICFLVRRAEPDSGILCHVLRSI